MDSNNITSFNQHFLFPGKAANEVALRDEHEAIDWQTLTRRTGQWLHLFSASWQLKPASNIAILMDNQADYICCLLAGLCAGIWITPINGHLKKKEITHILEDAGSCRLITDRDQYSNPVESCYTKIFEISSLRAEVYQLPEQQISPEAEPGGFMMYTSGTTGLPKGVRRAKAETLTTQLETIREFGRVVGVNGQGPHLVTGPLYHAAPGLFALYDLLNGATLVLMPKWDSLQFLELVQQHKIRHTHLVPIHFERLLKLPDTTRETRKPESLDLVLHGAAPVNKATKKAVIDWWGPILTEYWGATETGVITLCSSRQWLSHPGTVGKALPFYQIEARNEHGKPLRVNQVGTLYARHTNRNKLFSYHKDPAKTQDAHPEPGIATLGDIGFINDEGYVFLTDRKHRMIISGGVNVYPAEIEAVLKQVPTIADAAVLGIPDAEWGEQIVAVIVLEKAANEKTAEEALREIANEQLASFKHPRHYHFVDTLPRSPSGKLIDRYLREGLAEKAQ